MSWSLVLPMPVRANRLVRPALMGKTARLVKTTEARESLEDMQRVLRAHQGRAPLLIGPVRVDLGLHFSSIASDIDGRVKALLQGGAG